MFLSRRSWLIGAAVAVLAFLPSCNKDSGGGAAGGGEKITIGVVTNNPADFWNFAEQGANDAAAKHGVKLIFRRPEKGDAAIQRDIVNDLVNKGVQGIAVSVINPDEQTPDLKNVAEKTNLITMDNDAINSGRLNYVGTDNYEAGKAAGRLVKEVMPQGGMVAIFVGQITPINARQRYQGVVDELAGEKDSKGPKHGKYTVYKNEAITDGANEAVAKDNAADALEKLRGEANLCMVGLWAYNAPGILEAARGKGLVDKIKIVAFDEMSQTLAAIEKGEIYGTIVQDPYNFGFKCVELLAEVAKTGDKSKAKNFPGVIPYRIVFKTGGKDRMSVQDFNADLNKKMGK